MVGLIKQCKSVIKSITAHSCSGLDKNLNWLRPPRPLGCFSLSPQTLKCSNDSRPLTKTIASGEARFGQFVLISLLIVYLRIPQPVIRVTP